MTRTVVEQMTCVLAVTVSVLWLIGCGGDVGALPSLSDLHEEAYAGLSSEGREQSDVTDNLERLDRAQSAYERILEIYSEDPLALNNLAYVELAMASQRQRTDNSESEERALDLLRHAIAVATDDYQIAEGGQCLVWGWAMVCAARLPNEGEAADPVWQLIDENIRQIFKNRE